MTVIRNGWTVDFHRDPVLPRRAPVEEEMTSLHGVYTDIVVILRMDWSDDPTPNATLIRRWGK